MIKSLHKFHVPVMGLAYTIDSPIKLAPFGISSVISIVEDHLIESMRGYYYSLLGEECRPISHKEDNYRQKRITDYLNLVDKIVTDKFERLKKATFEKGSEIVQYFEMLPDDSTVKKLYDEFQKLTQPKEKLIAEKKLRDSMLCGSIDVNIMTKLDKDNYDKLGNIIENGSDALTALTGYAKSNLNNSSIIFSAGMNPRLYNYLENFDEFDADEQGNFKKAIVIKVSDYRSAFIQGKYLAKKGIWVSEFRIESGLNCGGHAFATDGFLMGPILEEFKQNKEMLITTLFEIYQKAVFEKRGKHIQNPPQLRITAQGGVGTSAENDFLINHYKVDSVGWGTPFLLVPEATTVDAPTLQLLQNAGKEDVELSNKSPLGIRFHFLKNTSSDIERQHRINEGKPGSPCPEKFLVSNTEFTQKPICTASLQYQNLKIQQLQSLNLSEEDYKKEVAAVVDKECLCVGLSNAAITKYKLPFLKHQTAVTICPGPNITYFDKIVSLKQMIGHIYGRNNILPNNNRPHFFISELQLYVSHFKELLATTMAEADKKKNKLVHDFYNQLQAGIQYYKELTNNMSQFSKQEIKKFEEDLNLYLQKLDYQFQQFMAAKELTVITK
jgi:hypothetical protein